MKTFLVSIAALSTVLAGTPALAQSNSQSVNVRLSDINLSTVAGRTTLDRRIAAAKEAVCGSYMGVQDAEAHRIDRCRAEVSAAIAPQVAAARSRSSVATR